jgi:hypothetical protein
MTESCTISCGIDREDARLGQIAQQGRHVGS